MPLCEYCRQVFHAKSHHAQRFCSNHCASKFKAQFISPELRAKMGMARRGIPAWNKTEWFSVICQQCNKSFNVPPYRQHTAKFCSHHCQSLHKTTIRGKEHPLFTRIVRHCQKCGKEVWIKPAKANESRFCSRQCLGAWTIAHFQGPSSIETMVGDALKALHIPFEQEYRIGRYSCDFALVPHKIIIEADGTYWHSLSRRKRTDKAKDKYLEEQGWQVFRFQETDIKTNLLKCFLRLNQAYKLL